MKKVLTILICVCSILLLAQQRESNKGSVIFIHPDGTSLADWNALRILTVGPDNEINWDKLTGIGLYQGHIKDRITSSSNAGATIHAYGVKAEINSFGTVSNEIPTALSGKKLSIMKEAQESGIYTGLINSGSIIEPGTAVFVSSSSSRSNYAEIAKTIIESGVDLIFSGGEEWMLPLGKEGRHIKSGKREDGINLIEMANDLGYKVVYDKYELTKLSTTEQKVLGVFSAVNTFNDMTEEEQRERGFSNYSHTAPTLEEMTEYALNFFSLKGQFFLVIEEEGSDNFGNYNNAQGKISALKRADDAIGTAIKFIDNNTNTLLITASDSEAGGMEIVGYEVKDLDIHTPLPSNDPNGSPIDGVEGTATLPFISAPDQHGNSFPFGFAWSTLGDVTGSVIARAHGLNADKMKGKIDNTFIYRLMYYSLFGQWLEKGN